MINDHSILPPSGSKIWMNCSAAHFLKIDYPERCHEKDFEQTEEGTIAHDWAHKANIFEVTEQEIPEKYRVGLDSYLSACADVSERCGGGYSEIKVPLVYKPEDTGTSDYFTFDSETLYIKDLKWGFVEVEAEENTQLLIYALGSLKWARDNGYDVSGIKEANLEIHQPNLYGGQPVKTWTLSVNELLDEWLPKINKAAKKIYDGVFEYNVGEHCKHCPMQGLCNAHWKEKLKDIPPELLNGEAEDGKLLELITPEIQARLILKRNDIKKFLDNLHDQAKDDYLAGRKNPFLKLVDGRKGHRFWVNEEEATKEIVKHIPKRDALETKLKSPNTIMALLKPMGLTKKAIEKVELQIDQPSAGYVLTSVTDKKESSYYDPTDLFNDISQDFDNIE